MQTAGLLGLGLGAERLPAREAQQAPRPVPAPAQFRWQEAEIGIIFHFDMPIAAGVFAPNNAVRRVFDPNRYAPARLDTDQWVAAAKAAGARYAVFTATHFNGFLQWQSEAYPYGLKQSRWRNGKGDVVGDFVRSCRKAGLLPGLYLSTHRNAWWTVWGHWVDWGKGRGTPKQAAFNRAAEQMARELCSHYGPLIQIWYDAGVKTPEEGGPDVLPIFEKHQPDSVFYHNLRRSDHRWVGNEAGAAGDPCWATMPNRGEVSHNSASWQPYLKNGDPQGSVWSPAMCDTTLRGARGVHHWVWRPNGERGIRSVENLLSIYETSVGRNSNLVLGVVITPEGLVPEPDARRLAEFGKALRPYLNPLAETSGQGAEVTLRLSPPQRANAVVLMEDIRLGERVREHSLEGLQADGQWTELARGQSIGHKWIHRFPLQELAAIRLHVRKADRPPRIRRLAALRLP